MAKYLAVGLWAFVVFHLIANWYSWYYTYLWLDMPVHAAGAFLAAWLGWYIIFERWGAQAPTWYARAFIILGFVSLIAIAWEFHEFIGDLFIKDPSRVFQAGVGDTMSDLFFDLLGGSIFLLLLPLCQKLLSSPEGKN